MRSVAFLLAHGEPREGFFPDTLLRLMCAEARSAGHRAELVRLYYDGHDPQADARVRERLASFLEERAVDVVVVERLVDPTPVLAYTRARADRQLVHASLGDGDPVAGVDWLVGKAPGLTTTGRTRRMPSVGEVVSSFAGWLAALSAGQDPLTVPGVSAFREGRVLPGLPSNFVPLPRPFAPVLEDVVIAPGEPPPVTRRHLVGNAGCPFAADPADNPFYAGVSLPVVDVARLGCAFCSIGGDYQKRDDGVVVAELMEQARWFLHGPGEIRELVLGDQHPIRYLKALMEAAHAAGLPRTRWLFPARADTFVRDAPRIEAAVVAAEAADQELEVYLSGFESFSDRELVRYNKGVEAADLETAVLRMRALSRAHPRSFAHARAKGHSLILFSPWTTLDDLTDNVAAVRKLGLGELFATPTRNRLRLHPDLPIHHAAARDGALLEAWQDGDEGAARVKGYDVERPWRFLDARTRLAFATCRAVVDALGPSVEVAALAAAIDHARAASTEALADVPAEVDRVRSGIQRLASLLATHRSDDRPAAAVAFSGACNNGCTGCANGEVWIDDASLEARVDAARGTGRAVVLAGREPTMHSEFLRLVRRASGEDGRPVGVVSNGRRFAHAAFAAAAVGAGLSFASIKAFGSEAEQADGYARVPGAHEQAITGIGALRAAGTFVELRAHVNARALATMERLADTAATSGASALFLEIPLDALGLASLDEAAERVSRLAARAAMLGVPFGAAPLSIGMRGFGRVPRASASGRSVVGPQRRAGQ